MRLAIQQINRINIFYFCCYLLHYFLTKYECGNVLIENYWNLLDENSGALGVVPGLQDR